MRNSGMRGSRWSGRFVAIMVLPVALYALYATGQKAVDSYALSQQAESLRAEIVSLQHDNLRLQHELEIHRGDAYVERMAREQLGLVKPGDQALVIIPSDGAMRPQLASPPRASSPPTAAASEPVGTPPPMWRRWWVYFFSSPATD